MKNQEKEIRDKADILEAAKCREIVQEIMNFGINHRQLLITIKLLSLELDSNALMKKINEIINEELEENIGDTPKITI
jgi:hypothetical protein|tara:strand:- start:3792 stop:4025 length:234 start_codon:yes stop_codon:yes gene_type:complete